MIIYENFREKEKGDEEYLSYKEHEFEIRMYDCPHGYCVGIYIDDVLLDNKICTEFNFKEQELKKGQLNMVKLRAVKIANQLKDKFIIKK